MWVSAHLSMHWFWLEVAVLVCQWKPVIKTWSSWHVRSLCGHTACLSSRCMCTHRIDDSVSSCAPVCASVRVRNLASVTGIWKVCWLKCHFGPLINEIFRQVWQLYGTYQSTKQPISAPYSESTDMRSITSCYVEIAPGGGSVCKVDMTLMSH